MTDKPKPLSAEERDSFRRYAEANETEPNGDQSQWADYTLRLLHQLAEKERQNALQAQYVRQSYEEKDKLRDEVLALESKLAELRAALDQAREENARLLAWAHEMERAIVAGQPLRLEYVDPLQSLQLQRDIAAELVGSLTLAEAKARAELAEAHETIKALNRRAQLAESAAMETVEVIERQGGSLGRTLANAAASMYKRERDEARAELGSAIQPSVFMGGLAPNGREMWIAFIDYMAQGGSEEEARQHFAHGWRATQEDNARHGITPEQMLRARRRHASTEVE